ncbi:MAG: GNAT family N-acetyltransferase [Muribaculaceae bacterium]|nr:GNAT family N-acetyltransferase [Muribaculaceae bacterium]
MINTPRLILRHWRPADADDLFRYASDSLVSEKALWPTHTSVEMSRQVINDYFMPNTECFAITLKDTGEAIGCIGLVPIGDEHYPTLPGEREVGYWIGRPHWGKGIASEALRHLIAYCRSSLGLSSLLITADITNTASLRVAEKCGFVEIARYTFDSIDSAAYRLML